MKNLLKYIENLKEKSKNELSSHFNIDGLNLEDFELINSYLIHQAIRSDKGSISNSLIYIPSKDTKSKFYLPVIFMLAAYHFIDNCIDDATAYQVGDILQEKGITYKIIGKTDSGYRIVGSNSDTHYPTKEQIKNYIITNGQTINARKSKTKFHLYKSFINKIIPGGVNYVPSKFKHKSVIVAEKKIVDELKKFTFAGEKNYKSIPFRYISKSGDKSDNIPIDPMLYIVNDYDTVREFILNEGIPIQNVTIVGSTKYREKLTEISADLNNAKFKTCLLIGSTDLSENSIPDLLSWKWTLPELDHFNYFETENIIELYANSEDFENALVNFTSLIAKIEKDYEINLQSLFAFVRRLFKIVLPFPNSRLSAQIDNILASFNKVGRDLVDEEFYEIDEYDYEEIWEEIASNFQTLVDIKSRDCSKSQKLGEFTKIDVLVVPKGLIQIWNEVIKEMNITVRKIASYEEFKKYEKKDKIIVFLGFYGFAHYKEMLYNYNQINLLLNKAEKKHFESCKIRFENETLSKIKSPDREELSKVIFKEEEQKEENVTDIIKRIFNKEHHESESETKIESEPLIYTFTFEGESKPVLLEQNTTVLIIVGKSERDEKVKNLMEGDKIRVYENSSRETLYSIAQEADESGDFKKIEHYANLWKEELIKYSSKFNNHSELLSDLRTNGLSIQNEATLSNWKNPNNSIKFPQKNKDLSVLKRTINSQRLTDNFKEIIKFRRIYNGIMIALGRDFSDEISQFIKTKKKGKILSRFGHYKIQELINNSAPIRTIKTIEIEP